MKSQRRRPFPPLIHRRALLAKPGEYSQNMSSKANIASLQLIKHPELGSWSKSGGVGGGGGPEGGGGGCTCVNTGEGEG